MASVFPMCAGEYLVMFKVFGFSCRLAEKLAGTLVVAVSVLTAGDVSPAKAADETTLSVAAIGEVSREANEDGFMLAAIMDAALRKEISDDRFSVSTGNGTTSPRDALTQTDADLSFPWYKPNCDGNAFLTSYTTTLCTDFQWSDSIYEVVVGYFTAKDYDRPLRRHVDVYGTTLCVSGVVFPQMLHEVGISDLNTRVLVRRTPAACIQAVNANEADVTLLPISRASVEVERLDLVDEIVPNLTLDRVLSLHAIAPRTSETAAQDLELLNSGIRKIRKNGEWFEIIATFSSGR